MDKDSLRDLVSKLHSEMTDALRADPKSREQLSEMMQDINRLIASLPPPGRGARVAAGPPGESRSIQADHPTLAASARRLVDLLGEVGI
jgi:hypothetical protein